MPGYNPTAIEKKWQKIWQDHKVFAAPSTSDNPKYYALDMFPYPSGAGLHVGHPEGYTATDILSRYKRARGFAVMHPMGWDAFGLPAEQYAVKEGKHPREFTQKNIARFRAQLQAIGFSYDWDREVDTTDPNYYKWTQWIFLQLYDTWFDETQQKGRPISELIAEFRDGTRTFGRAANENRAASADRAAGGNPRPTDSPSWNALSPTDQRRILADYRLAYESEVPVNWCPGLGTVLANEEVVDGKSEVGGFPVERRPMKQWMLRITAYAQRLLDGLEKLEWSDSLKEMQRNWIGKSEGAEVHFDLDGSARGDRAGVKIHGLDVFTTRPDTLYGATYMVLAPEHWMARIDPRDEQDPSTKPHFTIVPERWPEGTREEWKRGETSPRTAVKKYQQWAATRSDRERQEDTQKTGAFTGMFAINPVNGGRIPVFISDYVLMGYGTGAIMAVPAHDERDHEFATKFKLPIVQVVAPKDGSAFSIQHSAFTDAGLAINSPWIDGLPTPEAKAKITAMLEEKGLGKKTINFKIRDWLFSRQRYWGEPFPLVHLQDGTTVPLADSELPLKLPELEDFKPTGTIDPPLSKSPQWFNVHVCVDPATGTATTGKCAKPECQPAKRELNTMPQWAGSCWYYLRYLDPKNNTRFVDPAIERYWLGPKSAKSAQSADKGEGGISDPSPCLRASVVNCDGGGVDMYIGGVEHAVLHLLYSRFWHKVLFDRGLVSSDEPFRRLVNQGLILGEAEYTLFKTEAGVPVSLENVYPEFDTRTGPDGRPQIISKHKQSCELLVGHKVDIIEIEKRAGGAGASSGSPDNFVLKSNPAIRVDARSFKMSKSRGNVINPDDVIAEYGADSLRMFEMFMGPLEQVKPWSTAGVEGVYRFLQRVWRNLFDENDNPKVVTHSSVLSPQSSALSPQSSELDRPLHRLIKKVTDDIERMSFNTAIPAMMEFNNTLAKSPAIPLEVALTLLRLMEPFAPHFADEAYHRLTQNSELRAQDSVVSISQLPWPTYDPAKLIDATLDLPVQINGKLKGRITVPNDADEATVFAAALSDPELQKQLAGKEPKKKIYVKGRMVNLVV